MAAMEHSTSLEISRDTKQAIPMDEKAVARTDSSESSGLDDAVPTEDELNGPNALRRISDPIPWSAYTVAFVELCERFSYYGTQVLCTCKLSLHRIGSPYV